MTIGVQYSAPMSSVVSADLAESLPDHAVGDRLFLSISRIFCRFSPEFCSFWCYLSASCGAVFQPLLYCLSASMVLTPRICVSAFRTDVAAVNRVKSTQMASWRAKPSPGSPAGQPTQALLLASQPKLSLPGSGLLLRFPPKSTPEARLSLLE